MLSSDSLSPQPIVLQIARVSRLFLLFQYFSYRLLSSAVGFKTKYLSWQTWQKWCINMFGKMHITGQTGTGQAGARQSDSGQTNQGESPATEVLKFRDPTGHFTGECPNIMKIML